MRIRALIFALLLVLILATGMDGQSAATRTRAYQDTAKFVGVWRGEFDSLPGVDMVISDEGEGLAGGILFYLHIRPDAKTPYTSRPGLPEPMLRIRLDEQTMHFELSHRRAHAPATLGDAPKEFQLKLIGPDRAELINESGGAPGLVMKRTDY